MAEFPIRPRTREELEAELRKQDEYFASQSPLVLPDIEEEEAPEFKPIPITEPKNEAGFWSSFKDTATTLFDSDEALKYGIKSDDTTREALLKAQEASGESLGGLENVKNGRDFWRWIKELAGGSAGFLAPAAVAARAATMLTPFGWAGTVAGLLTLGAQYTITNLGRQAQENQRRVDAGEEEVDASIAKAGLSAGGQTALDFVGLRFFPALAKLVGFGGTKVAKETAEELAKKAKKNLAEGKNIADGIGDLKEAQKLIRTTTDGKAVAKGAGMGAVVEGPQEVLQSLLERAQAGLDLTGEEATKEYIEAAVGGAILGSSIGSVSGYATNRQKQAEQAEKQKEIEELEDIQTEQEAAARAEVEAIPALPAPGQTAGSAALPSPETVTPTEEFVPDTSIETQEEARILTMPEPKIETINKLIESQDSPFSRAIELLSKPTPTDTKKISSMKEEVGTALKNLGVPILKKQTLEKRKELLQEKVNDIQGRIDSDTVTNKDIESFLPSKLEMVTNAIAKHDKFDSPDYSGKYLVNAQQANKAASALNIKKKSSPRETMEAVKEAYTKLQSTVQSLTKSDTELATTPPQEITKRESDAFFKGVERERAAGRGTPADVIQESARTNLGNRFFVYKRASQDSLEGRIKKQKQKQLEGEDKKQPLQVFLSKEKAESATEGDGPIVRIPATPDMITNIQAKATGSLFIDIGDVNAVDIQQKGSSEFEPIELRPTTSREGMGMPGDGRRAAERTRKAKPGGVDVTGELTDVSPSAKERGDTPLDKGKEALRKKEREVNDEKAEIENRLNNEILNDIPTNYTEPQQGFIRGLAGKAQNIILKILPVKAIAESWGKSISYKNASGETVYPIEKMAEYVETLNANIIGDTREAKLISNNLQTYVDVNDKNGRGAALARLLRLSSFSNMDASVDNFNEVYKDRDAKQRNRIEQLYNKLDADGQTIYKEIGNYFKTNFEKLKTNLEVKINDLNISPDVKEEIRVRLKEQFDSVGPLDYYFPLQRQGDYWLNFIYDGEFVSLSYKTEAERNRRYASLKRQEKTNRSIENVETRDSEKDTMEKDVEKGISSTNFRQVMEILERDKSGVTKDTKEAIKSLFINGMPETSIYKNLLKRKNILGFEPDIPQDQAGQDIAEIFNEKVISQARQINRLAYQGKIENELANVSSILNKGVVVDMDERVAREGTTDGSDMKKLKEVEKSLREHYNQINMPNLGSMFTNPFTGKKFNAANKVGQVGFYYYLTSPASAMVNLFQTPTVAAGLMAGKFGTKAQVEIFKALGSITKQRFARGLDNRKTTTFTKKELYGATGNPTIDNEKVNVKLPDGLSKDEQINMARAIREGTIEQTQVGDVTGDDLQGLSAESLKLSKSKFSRVHRIVFGAFQLAERMNREVTFLAAYRLAKKDPSALKKGDKYKDAFDYAKRMTDRAHGDYSHSNSGLWFKSPNLIGRSMLMFKKFPVLMFYNYYAAFRDAKKKGASKEEIGEARKQLMGMLGYGFIASGLQGVPLYFVLDFALGAIMSGLDEEGDEWLAPSEAIRQTVGEIFYSGPIQALTGIELASRVGLGESIVRMPSSEQESTLLQLVEALGGPAFAIFMNAERGYDIAFGDRPDFLRGVEAASPTSLKNILKAVRYYNEGTANTLKGLPIVEDLDGFQIAMQALGFTPAELSRQYDLNNARNVLSKEINGKRKRLIYRAAISVMAGDTAEYRQIQDQIIKFNRRYPEAAISKSSISKSAKMRQRMFDYNRIYDLGGMNLNPRQIDLIDVWEKEN